MQGKFFQGGIFYAASKPSDTREAVCAIGVGDHRGGICEGSYTDPRATWTMVMRTRVGKNFA